MAGGGALASVSGLIFMFPGMVSGTSGNPREGEGLCCYGHSVQHPWGVLSTVYRASLSRRLMAAPASRASPGLSNGDAQDPAFARALRSSWKRKSSRRSKLHGQREAPPAGVLWGRSRPRPRAARCWAPGGQEPGVGAREGAPCPRGPGAGAGGSGLLQELPLGGGLGRAAVSPAPPGPCQCAPGRGTGPCWGGKSWGSRDSLAPRCSVCGWG